MPSTRRSSNVTPSRRNTVSSNPNPAPTPTRRTTTRAAATRAAINIDMQMGSSDEDDDEESASEDDVEGEEEDGATSEAQEPEDEEDEDEKQPAVAHLKVPTAGRLKRVLSSNASSEYNAEADGQPEDEREDEELDVQPRAGQRQRQRRAVVGRKRVVDDDDEDEEEEDDGDGEDEIDVEEGDEAPTSRYPQKTAASRSVKLSTSPKKPIPKSKPTQAPQASTPTTLPRIKLKLGGAGGPSAFPMSASTSNATSTSASSTQRGKTNPAQRRIVSMPARPLQSRGRQQEEESDEDDEEDEDIDVEGDGEGDDDGEIEEEDVGVDVESEDEESSEQEISEVRKTTARLTARQAILATTAPHLVPSNSSLISLDDGLPPSGKAGKKKHLTEMELALRREETARKRKNLSEKKLEDEKAGLSFYYSVPSPVPRTGTLPNAETINRLLKKQSRPRARRQNTDSSLPGSSTPAGRSAGTRTPRAPVGPTRLKASTVAPGASAADGDEGGVDDEGEEELVDVEEGEEGEEWEDEVVQEELRPTMFRWVSRAVPVGDPASAPPPAMSASGMDVDGEISTEGAKMKVDVERKMVLSFSIPVSLIPAADPKDGSTEPSRKDAMDVDAPRPPAPPSSQAPPPPQPKSNEPAVCAIAGCGAKRKYRLVRDWTVGACGIGHLKVLEAGA